MAQFQRFAFLAAGLSVLALPFLAAHPARADGIFSMVPTVRVAVPKVESQAQLADRLRAQGYTNVILSSTPASPANPYPQNNSTLTSHPEQTPVHAGWNGVAMKEGQIVQVYAERLGNVARHEHG